MTTGNASSLTLLVVSGLLAATGTAVVAFGVGDPGEPVASVRAAVSATEGATLSAGIASAPQVILLAPHTLPLAVRLAAAPPTAVTLVPSTPRRTVRPSRSTAQAPAPAPVTPTAAAAAPAPEAAPATRGDDYPWRTAATNDSDTWGFTKRQCVSFAAFRLAQRGKAIDNASQHWGSALDWDETARSRGVPILSSPQVGAIAQWNAGESSAYYGKGSTTPNGSFTAGPYGHVGVVAAVYSDGSALIEQYNLGGDRAYSVLRVKAPRYLIF